LKYQWVSYLTGYANQLKNQKVSEHTRNDSSTRGSGASGFLVPKVGYECQADLNFSPKVRAATNRIHRSNQLGDEP
jgi:hypothetical protein